MAIQREEMRYDVVIVGAGPAGLSAAIKIKTLALETKKSISVCVLEKGAEIGSHIISGAVIETKALEELIPEWKNDPDLEMTKVNKESLSVSDMESKWTTHKDGCSDCEGWTL